MVGELTDATKKLLKEKFKQYLERRLGEDSRSINFMIEMFDASIDLLQVSIRKKGMPTQGDFVRYFAAKGSAFSVLSSQTKVACLSSMVGFISDASQVERWEGGPAGVAVYIAYLVYDGFDTFENCDLAALDYKLDQDMKAWEEALQHKRAIMHANAMCEITTNKALDASLVGFMERQGRDRASRHLDRAF